MSKLMKILNHGQKYFGNNFVGIVWVAHSTVHEAEHRRVMFAIQFPACFPVDFRPLDQGCFFAVLNGLIPNQIRRVYCEFVRVHDWLKPPVALEVPEFLSFSE